MLIFTLKVITSLLFIILPGFHFTENYKKRPISTILTVFIGVSLLVLSIIGYVRDDIQDNQISDIIKCKYDEISEYINGVKKGDINVVENVAIFIVNNSKNTSNSCRSKVLSKFREYYFDSLRSYNEQHTSEMDYYGRVSASLPKDETKRLKNEISDYEKQLEKAGWELGDIEGMLYVQEKSGWMEARFEEIMPTDWKQYYSQRSIELEEEFTYDAILRISFEDLRKRIIFWEEFVNNYPFFPLREEIEYNIINYIQVYLTGLDNTLIYDRYTNELKDSVEQSYNNFITVNQNSKYYPIVKEYYSLLKSNQFVMNSAIQGYIDKQFIKSSRGIEMPRR